MKNQARIRYQRLEKPIWTMDHFSAYFLKKIQPSLLSSLSSFVVWTVYFCLYMFQTWESALVKVQNGARNVLAHQFAVVLLQPGVQLLVRALRHRLDWCSVYRFFCSSGSCTWLQSFRRSPAPRLPIRSPPPRLKPPIRGRPNHR